MRKVMVAVGVVLVAVALVALASMDTQLRLVLFGFPQTTGSNQAGGRVSQPGAGFVSQSSAALTQQTDYIKVAPYLSGAGGLALIILGSTLPPRAKKEKEEMDSGTPSHPPPWERSDISGATPEESSP